MAAHVKEPPKTKPSVGDKGRGTLKKNYSPTSTSADQPDPEKVRNSKEACDTWGIEDIANMFSDELLEHFKQNTEPNINIFNEDTPRAFKTLAALIEKSIEREQVTEELAAMWVSRIHGITPNNVGKGLNIKNEKLTVDNKRLIRARKKAKGVLLSAAELEDERDFASEYGEGECNPTNTITCENR
jgi:hypothetical protein